jgi:N-acyl amino acid synthase of PEP-CTERM/exosortase system
MTPTAPAVRAVTESAGTRVNLGLMHRDAYPNSRSDLSALYDRYFTVLRATTPELLDAAHALRYQVYCVEHPFEDPSRQIGEREMDHYDSHAVHAVLRYNPTGAVVGCVRLILPQAGSGLSALPIREMLSAEGRARLDRCDPARTAEISRYAVSRMFRRRASDSPYPDVDMVDLGANEMRRLVPHVSLGLMRGVSTLAAAAGITTVCAAMAPALVRLLERLGLDFESLGPLIDHHGPRQPCIADCDGLLAGLAARGSQFYELLDTTYRGDAIRSA